MGMRRASPRQPQNLGGRPITIDDEALLTNRNCWIGLLSYRWGSIGWSLAPTRVRTPEDVREALASVDTMVAAEELLLQPFCRTTTIVGTAASIRATLRKLKRVGERLNNHVHRDNVSRS